MSIFDDITQQLSSINNKGEGTLIRSTDWNNLVNQVVEVVKVIETQQGSIEDNTADVGALQGSVTDIETRVSAIENLLGADGDSDTIIERINQLEQNKLEKTEFSTFKSQLDPLLLQYSILLETESLDYQLGESATITAKVQKVNGDAVDARPWLDVIASWGQVTAVQGYEVLAGTGGRTVAVRCDSNGIAKFKIKAENAPSTSDVQESQIGSFFATRAQHQTEELDVRNLIDGSNNSSDPMADTFFAEMSQAYRNGSNQGLNYLVDGYQDHARMGPAYRPPLLGGRWNNMRSTIAVFAKDDAQSNTPDAGKGVSSIQINFKDWVGPWIHHYERQEEDFRFAEIIPGLVVLDDPLVDPLRDIEIYFDDSLMGLGSVGRGKFLQDLATFTREVNVDTLPAGTLNLIRTMGEAATMQVGFDATQSQGVKDIEVIKSTMRSGTRSQSASQQASGIEGKLSIIDQALNSVNTQYRELSDSVDGKLTDIQVSMDGKFGRVENNVKTLDSKVNETSVVGTNIQQMLGSIDNKVTGINVLDTDSVQGSIAKITADIGLIKTNISAIER